MIQSTISLSEIKLTLLASGVEYDQLDYSMIWAFGSLDIPIKEWIPAWNEKHKDIFEMVGTDTVFDTVYKVGKSFSTLEM